MEVLQRRVSPDGALVLVVVQSDDGELAVGFEGAQWHTHPDTLAAWLDVPEPQSIEAFIQKLETDTLPIIWSTDGGRTADPWVSDNLEATFSAYGNTNCVLRMWSGAPWSGSAP